mgnify:CR=1 FL=1
MTQQEIEEAIKQTEELIIDFDLSGDDRNPLNKLINLAKLHLQVMKSGVPKRLPDKAITVEAPSVSARESGRYWFLKINGAVVALVPSKELAIELVQKCFDRNQAVDEFTAYLAQKLSGLEGIVKESSLCHLCLSNASEGEREVKELVEAIRKNWMTK